MPGLCLMVVHQQPVPGIWSYWLCRWLVGDEDNNPHLPLSNTYQRFLLLQQWLGFLSGANVIMSQARMYITSSKRPVISVTVTLLIWMLTQRPVELFEVVTQPQGVLLFGTANSSGWHKSGCLTPTASIQTISATGQTNVSLPWHRHYYRLCQ